MKYAPSTFLSLKCASLDIWPVVWYVNFMSEHLRCIQWIRNQLTWLYRGYQLWEPVKSWSSCLLFMAQSRNSGYWMSFRPLTNTMMYTSSNFRKSRQLGCKPIFLEALNNNWFWKKYWLVINFVSVSSAHLHVL